MTSLTILNGTTITAAGQDYSTTAVSIDASAATGDTVGLEIKLVNGSISPGFGQTIDIFWAFTDSELTTDIAASLSGTASEQTLRLNGSVSTIYYFNESISKDGKYFNFWYSHDGLNSDVTMDVNLIYI